MRLFRPSEELRLLWKPVPSDAPGVLVREDSDFAPNTKRFHEEPSKKSLTRLLEHAAKDCLNRDEIIKALEDYCQNMAHNQELLVQLVNRLATGDTSELSEQMADAMEEDTIVGNALRAAHDREKQSVFLRQRCE